MSNCESCIVRKQSSLCALTPEEVDALDRSRVSYSLKKGENLFAEGENINGIYCLKEGACKMTKLSSNGNRQVVKLSAAGELLGQRSMISEEPAGLSAVAINDMHVCFIPKERVLEFFNRNNQFSMKMMKAICTDLKEANSQLVDMAQKTVKQRLAGTLLYLHDTFGTDQDGSLNLKLSREELAGIIGTATESCIRLLSELQKEGHIKLTGKNICLINTNSLKRLNDH
jgi:CRP-like cAMP-binding protein